jgi:hypothetical protein
MPPEWLFGCGRLTAGNAEVTPASPVRLTVNRKIYSRCPEDRIPDIDPRPLRNKNGAAAVYHLMSLQGLTVPAAAVRYDVSVSPFDTIAQHARGTDALRASHTENSRGAASVAIKKSQGDEAWT